MSNTIESINNEVYKLLSNDKSGHGTDHINRVLNLSLKFAKKENADIEIVSLIAILHDIDDYKLFGIESSKKLINTNNILNKYIDDEEKKNIIIDAIKSIGYSKRLDGIAPKSLEGKIVSDADMCDALGANGILRTYQYNINHNNIFFDKNNYPIDNIDKETYVNKKDGTVVNHMFEKLLKLKDMMLTESGKKEAIRRHNSMVEFLHEFFYEEDVPEWDEYLNKYLIKK